jgi:hypothetical protein
MLSVTEPTRVLFCSLQTVPASAIPDGWMGLDIGPESVKTFSEALGTTQTVIWNGPMGVFEFEKFANGTEVCKNRVLKFVFWILSIQAWILLLFPLPHRHAMIPR